MEQGRNPGVDGGAGMNSGISDRSIVVAAKDQVSCDLAGEAAILNIKNGVYYGLDPVGARIWSLMQEPRAVAEIQNTITGEYDVDPERCARDLAELLEKLLAEGLIEVKESSAA
jgi:Coenzyme PQQ synthesis protein D (PqqD)